MNGRRRRLLGLLAAVAVGVLGPAPAGHAADAGYVENGTDNPVTAAPPVSRPDTHHCTVTLADRFASNAPDRSPQYFSGTLTPPARCTGPWAKVVLDETISVSGRQYDRVGDLTIGGTEVYWGTTEEPSGATPITYHFAKDLTDYSALLSSPQSFHGGITNYVTDVYTGNYLQTVTLTYYMADADHPAPSTPDAVRGFPARQITTGHDTVHFTLSDLPRNITRAYLQVTLEGAGCDEQWFSAVPDDVVAKYPGAWLCGHGPYREALASLDGTPVGSVHTFPHIYSGGIVPTLWRPVPAIGTFDLLPETVDVTPFAGDLVDGRDHDLSVTIADNNDSWHVVCTLLLYTDHHASRTSGAVTTDTVAARPDLRTTEKPLSHGGTRVDVRARRDEVTAGWLDTSAGRVYTRVSRTMDYRNVDEITASGMAQHLVQSDRGTQTSTSTVNGHRVRGTRHSYSYPLSVDFSAADYTDDQNFSLSGTVEMSRILRDRTADRHGWGPVARTDQWLRSTGVEARTDGTTTTADGSSRSSFHGTDDLGRHYVHLIGSEHGRITRDTVHRAG